MEIYAIHCVHTQVESIHDSAEVQCLGERATVSPTALKGSASSSTNTVLTTPIASTNVVPTTIPASIVPSSSERLQSSRILRNSTPNGLTVV